MATLKKKDKKASACFTSSTTTPLNYSNPVRLAFLGGPKSGKTSTISKLTAGNFRDTYYPTHQIHPILFNYKPSNEASKVLTEFVKGNEDTILSPMLNSNELVPTNEYYKVGNNDVGPILVELIDTPSFNPQQVVPFLEASLYTNLDKEILGNLANEPRKPVSTNPLLVASGASELNGNINGYFFVYSAVPGSSPPGYDEDLSNSTGDNTFSLLPVIKGALEDAWQEYNEYIRKKNAEKEQDLFSFKVALRNLLKEPSSNNSDKKGVETKDYSPPIWILCTHKDSNLASPKLIEQGKQLAREWNCGFLAMDNLEYNIDILLTLMIRDIIERK